MKLRTVQPGELREDPHAPIIARINYLRRLLEDMKSCDHHPMRVVGCRGCDAWAEVWADRQ